MLAGLFIANNIFLIYVTHMCSVPNECFTYEHLQSNIFFFWEFHNQLHFSSIVRQP